MTLPTPAAGFRWTAETWGPALRCEPLAAVAQHVFTSRQLALARDDGPCGGGWHRVAEAAGGDAGRLARVRQVHGRTVRVLRRDHPAPDGLAARPEADALASNEPGLVLAVQVADCVPVLLADARAGAAAAVHAGWRGACAGIAAAAVDALARELGARPEDVTAAVGPCIRPCCYEVGEEVLERFVAAGHAPADLARWFTRGVGETAAPDRRPAASAAAPGLPAEAEALAPAVPSGKGRPAAPAARLRLDVARAVVDQLAAAGLPRERIFDCGVCTRCHAGVFASHRAHGVRAGRMAAAVRVPASSRISAGGVVRVPGS